MCIRDSYPPRNIPYNRSEIIHVLITDGVLLLQEKRLSDNVRLGRVRLESYQFVEARVGTSLVNLAFTLGTNT